MKAAVIEKAGTIQVRDLPVPKPNPYQALVRMDIVGVCSATDRKLVHGLKPFAPAYPALLGHEGVGTVIETGSRVRAFQPGDRVLRPCAIYPGHTGPDGLSSAWGSFAEYALVTDLETWRTEEPAGEHSRYGYARLQKKIPMHFSPEEACLLITWKETYSSLLQAGSIAGMNVAVLGDGAVGLSFVAWAKALGSASVLAVGRREFRLERAARLGATATCNVRAGQTFTGGRDFEIVMDTLGTNEAIAQSLPRLRPGGAFCVYGLDSTFETAFDRSLGPASWSYIQANPDEAGVHEDVIRRLSENPFPASEWITFRGGIDDLPAAFDHLQTPQSVKAVITFS
jgi:alcohol dehydrogenase